MRIISKVDFKFGSIDFVICNFFNCIWRDRENITLSVASVKLFTAKLYLYDKASVSDVVTSKSVSSTSFSVAFFTYAICSCASGDLARLVRFSVAHFIPVSGVRNLWVTVVINSYLSKSAFLRFFQAITLILTTRTAEMKAVIHVG